jgi:hypothetical protein
VLLFIVRIYDLGEYAKRHPVIRQDVKEYKTPEGESSFDVENIKN